MIGTVAGLFFMDFTRYNDGTCTTPLLHVHTTGSFNDLGPISAALPATRKFALNFSLAIVTPDSDLGVDVLNGLCACNGTGNGGPWQVNVSRVLMTCDPEDCDISFFGGTDIRFDQPAFSIVNVSADGGFDMGLMDIDPSNAFYGDSRPYLSYPTLEEACESTSDTNLCGSYASMGSLSGDDACEVLLNPFTNDFVGTARVNYTYRGPVAASPTLGQYGVFTRNVQYYSDARCTVLEATVDETGSMGYYAEDTTNLLFIAQKTTSSFSVQPASTARSWGTVGNLTNHCNCGDASAWGVGRARVITTCPAGTCETPTFNDFNTPGPATFAFVAKNSTLLSGEQVNYLAFGSWNISVDALGSSGLKYAMKDVTAQAGMQNFCDSSSFTSSLCGTYISGCSNSNTNLDVVQEMTLSGITTNRSSEGQITYAQDIYNNSIAGGCAAHTKIFDIKGTGYFSQDTFANVPDVQGLASVNIDFTAFTITPLSDDATTLLNGDVSGCKCGGTWAIGQARTLYSCPEGSCSVTWMDIILPGGDFGQAGFGVMQLNTVDNILRLSALDSSSNSYTTPFGVNTILMHQVAACPAAGNPADFAGCWDMPCYRVDADGSSYAMSGKFDADGASDDGSHSASGIFFLNRSVYQTSSGCAGSNTKLLTVDAEGSYSRIQSSPTIVGGQVTTLNIFYVTVTPINSAGVAELNSKCRTCSQEWRAGVSVTFDTTACDCGFLTTVAGIPIQKGAAHGVTKVWEYSTTVTVDDAFRMTTFSRNAASISTATLTRANGQYARADDAACPYAPVPNSGGSTGNNSGGLQGGDIFILLVFLTATIYFGGGMVLNYQRTGGMKNGGTPIIPHVTFWRALPGLVADGFRFVFVERFGRAGGGGQYSAFGGPSGGSEGGYGAL
jgi:hypothetical protein